MKNTTHSKWWWTGWSLMTFLSIGVAGYGFFLLLVPAARPPFLANSPYPNAVLAHFAGGAAALSLGPWQFLTGPRGKRSVVHRWIGRTYALAIAVAGVAGVMLSTVSMGGLIGHGGFFALGVLWLTTTTFAVRAARVGNITSHREWMLRSFALTFAAVTLRLQIPISAIAGIPFAEAYVAIAWSAWVPNLLVAEWMIQRRATRRRTPAPDIEAPA